MNISDDDWNMLDYFWNEKGDVTRWCGWEGFAAAYPGHPIVEAVARYESSKQAITLMIRGARP